MPTTTATSSPRQRGTLATTGDNRIRVQDRRNDGNAVYGRTDFQFFRLCGTATADTWCQETRYSTPETSSVVEVYLRRPLREDADKARGVSRACAQLGFPVPDACSNGAIVTFSY